MNWLKTALKELYGLFVDDGRFALAICVWIALVSYGLPRLPVGLVWRGPILFLGIVILLLQTVVAASRR